jgi:hypothetical protein
VLAHDSDLCAGERTTAREIAGKCQKMLRHPWSIVQSICQKQGGWTGLPRGRVPSRSPRKAGASHSNRLDSWRSQK